MPTTAAEVDALYMRLQRRLIESGEWDRIQCILSSKLNENGWLDDIRHRSKERAKNMDPLSFQTLLNEFNIYAQTSLPPAIKREITTIIRQYLDGQFE